MVQHSHVSKYYLKHRSKILSDIERKVGKDDAEDVLQEVFARATMYYDKWDSTKGQFGKWIFGITRNCIRGCQKDHKSRGMTVSVETIKDKESIEPSYDDNSVDAQQQIDKIVDLIEYKGYPSRDILYLSYILGFENEDIAKKLQIIPGTVATCVYRFKKEIANV